MIKALQGSNVVVYIFTYPLTYGVLILFISWGHKHSFHFICMEQRRTSTLAGAWAGSTNFCLWARVTLLDYHYLRTQTLGSHSARALTLDSQVHRDTFKLVMVTMCLCSMYVLYTYYYIWRRWSWWQIISSSFSLILPASFPYQTPVFSYIHTNLSMYCLLCAISWSVTDMSTWACN